MFNGALDSFSVKSNGTWLNFRLKVADKLLIPIAELNLGYKFTVDAQGQLPNALRSTVHFIEMITEAKDGLAEAYKGRRKKGKPFKAEIFDLDTRTLKEKGQGQER